VAMPENPAGVRSDARRPCPPYLSAATCTVSEPARCESCFDPPLPDWPSRLNFDLGAHLIELAAEMIERRPVLVLGDEYDVGILRIVRLSDQLQSHATRRSKLPSAALAARSGCKPVARAAQIYELHLAMRAAPLARYTLAFWLAAVRCLAADDNSLSIKANAIFRRYRAPPTMRSPIWVTTTPAITIARPTVLVAVKVATWRQPMQNDR